MAQVYDAVLAYAHALTRLHEAGTIDKVRQPSLDISHRVRRRTSKDFLSETRAQYRIHPEEVVK